MSCTPGAGDCPQGQTCGYDGKTKNQCIPERVINPVPGPNFESLPACMQSCIIASQNGTQTRLQDAVMGGLGRPIDGVQLGNSRCGITVPFCQQDAYKDTIYCTCQNIGVAHASCIYAPCANTSYAYKSVDQREDAKHCPDTIICANIVSVGGNGNVVQDYQDSNCGGVTEKLEEKFKAHPYIIILIIILFLGLAMTLMSSSDKPKKSDHKALLPGSGSGLPGLGQLPAL